MRTNKAFVVLLNVKEEIVRVDRIKTACVGKVSTKSLNQTGNPIANTATTENTNKPQEFDIPNNNCVLLRCLHLCLHQHGQVVETREADILSEVYSIHKQPTKLSTHQITNIAK